MSSTESRPKEISVEPMARAADRKREEEELLQQTKESGSVKAVLERIKEMQAAEKAKEWKPQPKASSGPQASDASAGYRNLSPSSSPYENDVRIIAQQLPDRGPPKKQDIKSDEKKDKTDAAPFKEKEEKSTETTSKMPTKTQQNEEDLELYEVIPADQDKSYEWPTEIAPQRPQSGPYDDVLNTIKTDSLSKRKESIEPRDVETMTVDEVAKLLKKLALEKYISKFKKGKVSGTLLKLMDKDVLTKEFGFKRFDAIKLTNWVETGHVP